MANLNTGNSKKFWSTINDLMGRKVSQELRIADENGVLHNNPEDLTNLFITFFVGKIETLDLLSPVCKKDVTFGDVPHDLFFAETEIKDALKAIRPSKAQGIDEIPSCVIFDLSNIIALHFTWLFNSILYTGIVPKSWKISKVFPIYKKGCPLQISNYRPISNTSSISKVFERALLNKMENMFSCSLINGPTQHGFISGSSTLTAALTIQDYVACQLDVGRVVLMYSADLSAAFDMLRQDILIDICRSKGFPESLCRVIHNFLSNRLAYVEIDGKSSMLKEIPIGCVQGSVLGPRLFNIYSLQDTKNSRNSFLSHSGLGNSYRHCDKQGQLVAICLPLFEFKTN